MAFPIVTVISFLCCVYMIRGQWNDNRKFNASAGRLFRKYEYDYRSHAR